MECESLGQRPFACVSAPPEYVKMTSVGSNCSVPSLEEVDALKCRIKELEDTHVKEVDALKCRIKEVEVENDVLKIQVAENKDNFEIEQMEHLSVHTALSSELEQSLDVQRLTKENMSVLHKQVLELNQKIDEYKEQLSQCQGELMKCKIIIQQYERCKDQLNTSQELPPE